MAGIDELVRCLLSDVARSWIFSWICVTGFQLEEVSPDYFLGNPLADFSLQWNEMPSVYFLPSCTISFHLEGNSAPANVGLLLPRAMDSVPVLFILDLTNCWRWWKATWYFAFFISNFPTIPHSHWKRFLRCAEISSLRCSEFVGVMMFSTFIHWLMLTFVLGFMFDCCFLQQTMWQNCISLTSWLVLELTLKENQQKRAVWVSIGTFLCFWSGFCGETVHPWKCPMPFVFGQPDVLMLEVEDVCLMVKYIALSQ